jgi:drug/metabolite transporter (DMT)-like permease
MGSAAFTTYAAAMATPVGASPSVANALLPRNTPSARGWLVGTVFMAAVVLATWASSTVALPVTNISPVFLPLAVGVAVLARRGRALWPAFVVGDVVGQLVAGERLPTWLALSVACHLTTVLIGATLIQRHRAWVDDLGSTARYLAIVAGLAVAAAVAGIIGLELHGFLAGPADALGTFSFWVLGDFGGYVVLGAAILVWSRPGVGNELRRPTGYVAVGVVAVAASAMVATGQPWWGVISLVAAGAVAARVGMPWGTAAMVVALAGVVVASVEGQAPFSGATPPYQAFNAMLAVAILSGASLLVAGYRIGAGGAARSTALVVGVLCAAVAITGLADFALLAMSLEASHPLAISSFLFAGATFGVLLVRMARPPVRSPALRTRWLAASSGLLNGLSFAAFYASVSDVGAVAASGLLMTYPAGVVLLIALRRRRLPSAANLLIAALVVGGALVIVAGVGAAPTGVLLAVVSALLFSAALLVADAAVESSNPVEVSLVSLSVAGVTCAVLALVFEGVAGFALSPQYVGLIALAAIGGTLVPQLSRLWALPKLGPVTVGAVASLGLVITAALGIGVLDDAAGRFGALGLVPIAVGGVLAAVVAGRSAVSGP